MTDKMQRKTDKMPFFFFFMSMVVCCEMQNIIVVLGNIWVTVMNWNILVYCRYLGLSLFSYLVASLAIVHV